MIVGRGMRFWEHLSGPPDLGSGPRPGRVGRLPLGAERCDQAHAALAVLLGLNGLRVSEACSANIGEPGFERGHRTLSIMGRGSKPAIIPLVPRPARPVDLAMLADLLVRPPPAEK